jgi:hypothetical protein
VYVYEFDVQQGQQDNENAKRKFVLNGSIAEQLTSFVYLKSEDVSACGTPKS